MTTAPTYLHLRVRTPYSLAEGALSAGKLADLCVQHGMPAVGVTDSNNLFGALETALALAKKGVQPVIGCALHIRPLLARQHPTEDLPPDKLYLYVQSEEGYVNLLALVSDAFLTPPEGADVPCVALENLKGRSAGLLVCTGTPDTALGKFLLRGKAEEAQAHLAQLQEWFEQRLYIGIARHGLPDEQTIEAALVSIAHDHGLPLLACQDVYFPDPDFAPAHEALRCIADGVTLSYPQRKKSLPEYAFQSPTLVAKRFADLPEALENTVRLAQRCAYMPAPRKPLLPRFTEGEGEEDALKRMAAEGLEKRLALLPEDADKKPYRERLDYELGIINQMGFPGYFLIVADFIQWTKNNGIPVGPGRGSGAGSVVAWALTITDLDPLRWGLLFERFLNPERVSMPDFDIDFCQDRRDEVIAYVQQKYGADKVAQIITFGKLQARAALRDVGRVLEMPYGQVDGICKLVPNNPANPVTLAQAVESEPQLAALKHNEETSRIIEISLQLEGLYRHASTHAAGVVIGDRPLQQLVPLYRDPKSALPATQFNMKYAEMAGLVKFDFLGLKTLSVMQEACRLVKDGGGPDIDLATLPLDDAKTYAMLGRGDTAAVFQLESAGMRDVLKKLKADRFEDIIALVALYRPGPMDNIPRYIACKHGEEKPDYLHPMLADILKETFGVIIYQEQVMQIAQVMGGYSLGGADLLRRAMGKKIKAEMDAQEALFLEGAQKASVKSSDARRIFQQVAKFAGYGFNKSHAAAYALVAYQTAWLKANWPEEFMAATMTYDAQNTDKLAMLRQELQKMQVPLLPPCINYSLVDFSVEQQQGKKAVRYALAAIKGVGESAVQPLIDSRDEKGAYTSIFDVAARGGKCLNKRLLESLTAAGAFDSLFDNRAALWDSSETILAYAASKNTDSGMAGSLFGDESTTDDAPPLKPSAPWNALQALDKEQGALGFYLSAHPLDGYANLLEQRKATPAAMLAEVVAQRGGGAVTLAGVATAKKERRSAKGNKYAFVQFSDPSGAYEVTFFSETLSDAREALDSGKPLLIYAEAGVDGDGFRLTAQSVRPLESLSAMAGLPLHLTVGSKEALSAIASLIEPYQGGSSELHLTLHLGSDAGKQSLPPQVSLELKHRYSLPESVRQTLKSLPGVATSDSQPIRLTNKNLAV